MSWEGRCKAWMMMKTYLFLDPFVQVSDNLLLLGDGPLGHPPFHGEFADNFSKLAMTNMISKSLRVTQR